MNIRSIIFAALFAVLAWTAPATAQVMSIDSAGKLEVSGNLRGASPQMPSAATMPQYPGGKSAWKEFLRSNINIRVPVSNKARPGSYTVVIWFVIDHNGKVGGIGADSNNGYGMEPEVIRCVRKTSDWIPAVTARGRKVGVTLRTVVIFTVKPNDVSIKIP